MIEYVVAVNMHRVLILEANVLLASVCVRACVDVLPANYHGPMARRCTTSCDIAPRVQSLLRSSWKRESFEL